jgi:hypothetical protein
VVGRTAHIHPRDDPKNPDPADLPPTYRDGVDGRRMGHWSTVPLASLASVRNTEPAMLIPTPRALEYPNFGLLRCRACGGLLKIVEAVEPGSYPHLDPDVVLACQEFPRAYPLNGGTPRVLLPDLFKSFLPDTRGLTASLHVRSGRYPSPGR